MTFMDYLSLPGPQVTVFSKRADDAEAPEFVDFVKHGDGLEHHVICNEGGMEQEWAFRKQEADDLAKLAEMVTTVTRQYEKLVKHVDSMAAQQATLAKSQGAMIEVTAEDLVEAYTEALNETEAEAG
ncbi:MAG TPA: hypothetical protein VM219_04875 [Phycisphaerae bacterium]|nr:hypothetical protein [Phycisphaerae bacterium]